MTYQVYIMRLKITPNTMTCEHFIVSVLNNSMRNFAIKISFIVKIIITDDGNGYLTNWMSSCTDNRHLVIIYIKASFMLQVP